MTNPKQTEPTDAMVEALEWYRDQGDKCRKIGTIPEGTAARNALASDGGRRASYALSEFFAQNTKKSERVEALEEGLRNTLPKNVALDNTNIPDSHIVPLDVTMGQLRAVRALIDGD